MIKLHSINKQFTTSEGQVTALKDINLTIKPNEIFGLIGYSGAGKSTLLRCINLLEKPTSGQVIFEDQDITNYSQKQLREVRKKMGMIFQHFNLLPSRTVFENVAFPLDKKKLSKKDIETKVNQLLDLVELKDKAMVYPSQLSGGQKQRVAIARALVNDPDVLLCDEATSALDPQTTQSILSLLQDVNQKLGITIIIITHEMSVVKQICHRVGIMEQGELVEYGDIVNIFVRPKKDETKQFIHKTTSLYQVDELIACDHPLIQTNNNQQLLHLIFDAHSSQEPIVNNLVKQYDVEWNIIFGNIELLNNTSIGNMVVKIEGDEKQRSGCLQAIKNLGVEVEVVK